MKDIKDDKVRALAIKNREKSDWMHSECVTSAFEFKDTPEGFDYWWSVVTDYYKNTARK